MRKTISIASGCWNEAGNIREFYHRLRQVFNQIPQYDYEIIIADNCSTDGTREILREIAAADKNFRVIMNSNNFGQVTSAYNAFLQCRGDAVIPMCSDLEDPPEVLLQLIKKWEEGYKVVTAIYRSGNKKRLISRIRNLYYRILGKVADSHTVIQNFTGFGLYDRQFMAALKKYHDPQPFFRSLVMEIGFSRTEVYFEKPSRKSGHSCNNFFTLYDLAMVGFVNNSKLPLRLAVFCGFVLAFLSLLAAFGYLVYKLLYWDTFQLGLAPLVIGLFFFSAVQLIFIGILGEYIGAIWTQVKNKPLAIEEEKINFDE